jgi:protocatechuate 3,4-dioxygenase beta subunit
LPVTPRNELGPFYRRGVPHEALLRRAGDEGLPLTIAGTVFTAGGDRLPGARIELWHADHHGRYDVAGDRFRADIPTSADGAWRIETVMPGHYPDRVCQHVHFLVRAAGYRPLVTQLYFATDPVFEGDVARNFARDPLIGDPALVRPVALRESGAGAVAECRFDIVVERA